MARRKINKYLCPDISKTKPLSPKIVQIVDPNSLSASSISIETFFNRNSEFQFAAL